MIGINLTFILLILIIIAIILDMGRGTLHRRMERRAQMSRETMQNEPERTEKIDKGKNPPSPGQKPPASPPPPPPPKRQD